MTFVDFLDIIGVFRPSNPNNVPDQWENNTRFHAGKVGVHSIRCYPLGGCRLYSGHSSVDWSLRWWCHQSVGLMTSQPWSLITGWLGLSHSYSDDHDDAQYDDHNQVDCQYDLLEPMALFITCRHNSSIRQTDSQRHKQKRTDRQTETSMTTTTQCMDRMMFLNQYPVYHAHMCSCICTVITADCWRHRRTCLPWA